MPDHPSSRLGDRLVGGLEGTAGVASAVLAALAISHFAAGRHRTALVLWLAALALRGGAALAVGSYLDARARRLRAEGHAASPLGLTAASLHERDVAVTHLSEQPAIDATTAGAIVVALGLALVGWAGGLLALATVVGLALLAAPAYRSFGRRSVVAADEFHRRRSALTARQLALLQGITDLRGIGVVDDAATAVAAASDAERRALVRGVRATLRSTLVTEFLAGVSVGLVAMEVGLRLWHGTIALDRALIAVLVTAECALWLRRYGSNFHRRDDARAARAVLGTAATAASPPGTALLVANRVRTQAPAGPTSFTVASGDRVVLRGPSGIGKTSLLACALGLRSPLDGNVARTSQPIGLVHPTAGLLDGTVRDNLTLGRSIDDATLRALLVELDVRGRAAELDSPLGANGRAISSGERVLLGVARAVAQGAALLVLDDVNGVLDAEARTRLANFLMRHGELGVLEATSDDAVLADPSAVVEMGIV